jgi:hypothetical protein
MQTSNATLLYRHIKSQDLNEVEVEEQCQIGL